MDCRTFHRKLEDYLEEGMDFAGRFAVERHAQQCLGCGKVLKDATRLGQMARELDHVKAPPNFEAALLARIQNVKARRRSALWKVWVYGIEQFSWRAMAAGVSATVLAGIGIAVLMQRPQPGGTSPPPAAARQRSDSPAAVEPAPVKSPAAADRRSAEAGAAPSILSPSIVPVGNPRLTYYLGEDWTEGYLDSGDAGYIEYMVPGPGDRQLIMRLPKSIRVRYGRPSEGFYIRNVSH